MEIDLAGKCAIVCGASKGIGAAVATELAALGASVTLVARRADVLAEVRARLNTAQGQRHHVLALDMADIAKLKAALAVHMAAAGPFHILVNNSGGPAAGAAHLAAPEDFEKAFTQHLIAAQTLVQSLLGGMKAEKYGRIINIISTSVKQPIKGLGVSNTIRAAVAGWAKTLAGELAPFGITVNNVLPGATDTDRMKEIISGKAEKSGKSAEDVAAEEKASIPLGRFARPSEIAQAAAFLASPAAAYITGINLPVDGGRTASL